MDGFQVTDSDEEFHDCFDDTPKQNYVDVNENPSKSLQDVESHQYNEEASEKVGEEVMIDLENAASLSDEVCNLAEEQNQQNEDVKSKLSCDSSNSVNESSQTSENRNKDSLQQEENTTNPITQHCGDAPNEIRNETGEDIKLFNTNSATEVVHDLLDESDDESQLSELEIEERTTEAKKLKDEGNIEYKNNSLEEAIRIYSEGIKICPKCSHKDRAILFSNRSACYVKMDRSDDAIKDCSEAISLHPQYLKVYLRRAQLYDKTEKYEEATKDYQKALEMDPSLHSARQALIGMSEKIELRNEKLKEQMMSSLKDLGNLFLRPFGLSTNNFQMQQNPDTGSYNLQFNNKPPS